ncbi:MAG: helix-turn-helix domain-containing protein [Planctomycetes bacterium]|nr:helix-turn-helix domain-containing protein [Planctomycetota bacterium]
MTKKRKAGAPPVTRKPRAASKIMLHAWGNESGFLELVDEVRAARTVGDILREARERQGLTQAELAKLVGTTQSAVSRLEEADRTIKLGTIQRIAKALEHRVQIRLAAVKS